MEEYWISFRVATGTGYDARYSALTEAINENCNGWWAETTSFYLANSRLAIDELGRALTAGLDEKKDTLIIRYLAKDASRYFGKVDRLDILKEHLPRIKKL